MKSEYPPVQQQRLNRFITYANIIQSNITQILSYK